MKTEFFWPKSPDQLPISRSTGGRSASPEHPSRKHDVERGPIIVESIEHVHSVPGRFSFNGQPITWQPRRRERRHLGGDRKIGRRISQKVWAAS